MESDISKQKDKFIEGLISVIFGLAKLAEARDKETGGHLKRMAEYTRALAQTLRKTEKFEKVIDYYFIYFLYHASYLHDIGKLGIPEDILLKTGMLSIEDFEIIKTHTTIGADILRESDKDHPNIDFIKSDSLRILFINIKLVCI
ncbi:MAG TPA: HD domain-containing protein [Victivallales bacterium]|nr:HD domain-containing protein [Victivallales bacterium]